MTLLDDLPSGALVGLDTAALIYFSEAHTTYGPLVRPLFEERIEHGINSAVTSVVSLAEILVKPLQLGRADLVRKHSDLLLATPHLRLIDITALIAQRAAELRSRYGLRLPDALQIASVLEQGATHFVTNDAGLRRVTELRVMVLQDYLPLPSP